MDTKEFTDKLNALYPDMYEFETITYKDMILLRSHTRVCAIKSQLYFDLKIAAKTAFSIKHVQAADYILENGKVTKDRNGDFK